MFYHKRGDAINRSRFIRPSAEVFNKWLQEFKKIPGLRNFNAYLTGAFCQIYFLGKDISTWDIDIFLTSDPKMKINYRALKYVLDEATRVGYRYDLLIDICWTNKSAITFEIETWADQKIRAFREIIIKTDKHRQKAVIDAPYKELIPESKLKSGLYLFDIDPAIGYNKFLYKIDELGYELPCKQLDI